MSIFFKHWKNYLLLLATVSYTAGIVFHSRPFLIFGPFELFVWVCLALSIATVGGNENKVLNVCILIIVFFSFGMFQGERHDRERIDAHHIAARITEPQTAVLVGTLSKMVTMRNGFSRASMQVSFLRTSRSTAYRKASGTIILNMKGVWPETIVPGRSFIVCAEVRPPRVINVPGAFNYRKYLARKNIFLTGFVTSPVLIQPVETVPNSVLKQAVHSIERMRLHIGQEIDASLPDAKSALYRALLIGDRAAIGDDLYETLKRAGVLHILAISGMHLGLLAAMTFAAIYWLMRRFEKVLLHLDARKYSLVLSLPFLLFYAFLAGFQPPVVRSLIMTGCLVIGYTVNRLQSPLTTLSCSALLILLFDPLAIESAAFQLSFTAVASIILIAQPLQSLLVKSISGNTSMFAKLLGLVFTLLAVAIAASVGTLPLMLLHFNRVSVVGIIANLLIEPIICLFSLPLGFFSLLLIYLSPQLSALIFDLGAGGIDLSIDIATFLSGPNFTQLWLPAPNLSFCLLYYLSLGVILLCRQKVKQSLIGVTGVVAALIGMYLPASGISRTSLPSTQISILDVGHGSANVLELKNGRVVLIDGGTRSRPGYDCGSRIIAPFLWSRNIAKVDDIFVTHDDADHYSGLASVIERFKPDRLWISAENSPKEGFAQLLAYAQKSGVEIVSPEPGVAIDTGTEIVSVLGSYAVSRNPQTTRTDIHSAADDNGLVVKFSAAPATLLFPGDITTQREQRLIADPAGLKSDILLSPHHGSSTSNSYEFLAAVDPDIIIFSNGRSSRGLFPAQETIKRVNLLDIEALETATQGTISITLGTERGSAPVYRIGSYNITAQTYWSLG